MKKMNPDVKSEWVSALRSGEFVQGTGRLSYVDVDGVVKHCCLGVLSELAVRNGAIDGFNGGGGLLSKSVQEWSGVSTYEGRFRDEFGDEVYLTDLNDHGTSFSAIADLIEEKF